MNVHHAVITDKYLYTIDRDTRQLFRQGLYGQSSHIADLWDIGYQEGITHFWIMPDTRIAAMGWDFLNDRDGYKIFIPGEINREDIPRSGTCKKGYQKDTFEIVVNYPVRGFSWIVNHPLDILASVDYLMQVTGLTDIKYSPQHIGKLALKSLYSATNTLQHYIDKPDATQCDMHALPFRQAGKEIYFARAVTPDMVGMHYHLYDKNSAHPSAASSMVTGIGTPFHVAGGEIAAYQDLKKAGIYRVTVSPNDSPFNGKDLPHIIDSEWVTRDLLKFALKQGYTVNAWHEAHIFEKSHCLFGDWSRDLWNARQALQDSDKFPYTIGRENAYYTAKEILNHSISAMTDNPNWWCDMVGMARVARLANLKKFVENGSPYPLYIYVDDMGFISPDSKPETAVPGIFERKTKGGVIDNRRELGGYKCKFSLLLTEEMVNTCMQFNGLEHKQAASKMHAHFKRIAKERGLIDA